MASGKHQKKTTKKKHPLGLILLLAAVAAIVVAAILLLSGREETPVAIMSTEPVESAQPEVQEEESLELGLALANGLILEKVGSYTGAYVEDGTSEVISGVMMAMVTNFGEQDVQYAEITLTYGEGDDAETRHFSVSDLPAGATAVLLEKNREQPIQGRPDAAAAENVAVYMTPMSLNEDVIEVTGLDGILNIRNISEEDITGEIRVHYKYKIDDVFYGGIAFRVTLEGGLEQGEIRQLMAGHYDPENCEILFVEYAP